MERVVAPRRRGARIVAVGDELLDGDRQETNSGWLARRLAGLGAQVDSICVVSDDEAEIAAAIRSALVGSLVLVSGGLGPTHDDRTREGIARALGRALLPNPAAEELIRARLRSVGREASSEQLRQALFPEGGEAIANPVGIAPGLLLRVDGGLLVALPGVPAELMPMFDAAVAPLVRDRFAAVRVRRVLRVAGRSESAVDGDVRDLLAPLPGGWTILAKERGIEIVLRACGSSADEAAAQLAPVEAALRARLGSNYFGDGEATLASVVGAALVEQSATAACAESCTGGLLSAALTELPGSSTWFRGGVVVYSDDLKGALAGVPAEIIERYGAVSEPVALALAEGARLACGAAYGIGVTGIAGPGGATPEKPVGLVHFAVCGPRGARVWNQNFLGDRGAIRGRAVASALDGLRRVLLGLT